MITYTLTLQTIASLTGIATSTSMIIAYRQLRLASRNSQLSFEDALAREFRQVANRIPFTAVLGGEISESELKDALPAFYMYFDLSDEQVFQRRHGRVSDLTWANWADGILDTVNRPAFQRALQIILAQRPDAFSDLRRFLDSEAREDPENWARTLEEEVLTAARKRKPHNTPDTPVPHRRPASIRSQEPSRVSSPRL